MIHPPGSAEQVAAFQNAQDLRDAEFVAAVKRIQEPNKNPQISGLVFDPVTRSYVTQAGVDAYMAFHGETNNCFAQATSASAVKARQDDEAYAAIQRVHEANMEKQEAEGYQTFPKPPLGGKPVEESTILEGDLHQAIARVLELQRFLRSLHPDVKKIINLGELLNEHK